MTQLLTAQTAQQFVLDYFDEYDGLAVRLTSTVAHSHSGHWHTSTRFGVSVQTIDVNFIYSDGIEYTFMVWANEHGYLNGEWWTRQAIIEARRRDTMAGRI